MYCNIASCIATLYHVLQHCIMYCNIASCIATLHHVLQHCIMYCNIASCISTLHHGITSRATEKKSIASVSRTLESPFHLNPAKSDFDNPFSRSALSAISKRSLGTPDSRSKPPEYHFVPGSIKTLWQHGGMAPQDNTLSIKVHIYYTLSIKVHRYIIYCQYRYRYIIHWQ